MPLVLPVITTRLEAMSQSEVVAMASRGWGMSSTGYARPPDTARQCDEHNAAGDGHGAHAVHQLALHDQ
jgi:hypothetical protein